VKKYRHHLKKSLSGQRHHHSSKVADLASKLAAKHGWDPILAYEAGFLHDCAKEWPPQKLIQYVKRYRLPVPNLPFIKKNNPNLLHAYVGADLARRKKWLNDRAALDAIRSHTLGAFNMSVPQMILYVADFSSEDRQYSMAKEVRSEAFRNLKVAFRLALSKKIKWNLKASKPVHPFTIQVWNKLVS
jgi:nicotinate-nucleotide adenylyltransferase